MIPPSSRAVLPPLPEYTPWRAKGDFDGLLARDGFKGIAIRPGRG